MSDTLQTDRPVFEICHIDGGSIKIWANGRTEGLEQLFERGWFIKNRIPLLIGQARRLGQAEAPQAGSVAAPAPSSDSA